ncbi:uncharacterized protein LOC131944857 [Physella acuta]|uniref:uncharacterized protein LOC131944857 n=1 Tax=Physella acuta TaxID=109671 RepID=UPI0027DD757E|nr:uncharacterized protein LOC131944857 [Physella acuta]
MSSIPFYVIWSCVLGVLVYGQQTGSQYKPNLPPPQPSSIPCTKASDCTRGICCLHGRCSITGSTFDRCYTRVPENGGYEPEYSWNKTDLCPCQHNYLCISLNASDVHPQYGPVGSCMPIMG